MPVTQDLLNRVLSTDYALRNPQYGSSSYQESRWLNDAFNQDGNDVFSQWLNPGDQQDKEFAQQMVAMMYQNAYNDPAAQMARMKAAGINPNVAAAGIAGNGNYSASPSAVPTAHPADPFAPAQAAATISDAATGGFASVAKGLSDIGLLKPTIDKIKAETATEFEKAGFTKAQTDGILIDNIYKSANWEADLKLKAAQWDNLKKQYDVLTSTYKLQMQQVETELEKLSLMRSEEGLNNANASYIAKLSEKAEIERKILEIELQFAEDNGFLMKESTIHNILFGMLRSGQDPTEFLALCKKYGLSMADAENESLNAHTYERYKAQFEAEDEYKRASNIYELGQRLIAGTGGYNWLNRILGVSVDGSIKDYINWLDESIDHLYNMIDRISDNARKEEIWQEIQELNEIRSMPRRQLMRYLNALRNEVEKNQ